MSEAAVQEEAVVEKKARIKAVRVEVAEPAGLHVYRAINEVKKELDAGGGITKDRVSEAGGRYNFRGIDDMYNVLCGLTAKHGICLFPRVTKKEITFHERQKDGKVVGFQTHAIVEMEIDIVSQVDGSKHLVATVGEGIDTSDKALNKAMSGAFKYAHLMAFQIPTHGEMIDSEVDHIPAQQAPKAPPAKAVTKAIEKVPVEKMNPPLDTSAKATDEALGMSDAADKANSAKLLFDLAGEAEKLPEPGRGVVFGHIHARVAQLVTASDQEELADWKALVKALGAPKELQAAFNARYNFFKQQQANA